MIIDTVYIKMSRLFFSLPYLQYQISYHLEANIFRRKKKKKGNQIEVDGQKMNRNRLID